MTAPTELAGTAAVEIYPTFPDFHRRAAAGVKGDAERLGDDVGKTMGQRASSKVVDELRTGFARSRRDAGSAGARAGEDFGAQYGRIVKGRVGSTLKTLPEIKIGADSTALERKVASARSKLAELADVQVGVDISDDEALLRVQQLRNEFSAISREAEKMRAQGKGASLPAGLDALKGLAELTAFKRELQAVQREALKPIRPEVDTSGFDDPVRVKVEPEPTGRFEALLLDRVRKAQSALPALRITADSTDAERRVVEIKARLAEISTKRVGVDIDADAAYAEVQGLAVELARLSTASPTVRVRSDTAGAAAELDGIQGEVRRLSGQTARITVDVDGGGAFAGLLAMRSAATAATSSVSGLGSAGALLGPLIVPAAAAAAAAIASIGSFAAAGGAGLAVTGLAFSGVFQAVTALDKAQSAAGGGGGGAAALAGKQKAIAAALEGVKSATASLANVRANADDAAVRSAQRVADAERGVASAKTASERAELSLTAARLDAARAMEDLALAVSGGEISERQARLNLESAQAALDKVTASEASSPQQRLQAQLDFDAATQRLAEVELSNKRLRAEKEAADKAGVDGSTQVKSALDAQQAATERVSEAQRGLVEAQREQVTQARQSQFAVEQALASELQAQTALQDAYAQTGAAGAGGVNKIQQALQGLTPSQREFAFFLLSLKPMLDQLKETAAGGILPGVQAGIESLLPYFPQLNKFVGDVAKTMGDLFEAGLRALGDPFWQDFFGFIGDTASPLLKDMFAIGGNLARAFASVVKAFGPLALQMGGGLVDMSAKFATFIDQFTKSPQFQEFIDYVVENGPKLLTILLELAVIFLKLAIALAPFAAKVLDGLVIALGFLAGLDPDVLLLIAGGLAAIIFAAGGPVTAAVVAVVALVALIINYWDEIKAVIVSAWEDYIKPVFMAIGAFIMAVVVPPFLFLWNNVVKPVWAGISFAIDIAWAAIQVVFGLIQIGLKILGAGFSLAYDAIAAVWRALYDNVIAPVYNNYIKPLLTGFGNLIKDHVAPAFQRGVDAVKSAWDKIQEIAKAPVRFVVNTVLNNGILRAYNSLARTFGVKPDNVSVALPFATGGIVPGYEPGRDRVLAMLSPGEGILRPEVVRAVGPETIYALNQAAIRGMLPAFAQGGIVGAVSKAADVVSGALPNPFDIVANPVNAALSRLRNVGGGDFGHAIASLPYKVAEGVWDVGKSLLGFAGGGIVPGVAPAYRTASNPPRMLAPDTDPSKLYPAANSGGPLIDTVNLYGAQMSTEEQVHAIGAEVSWVARNGTGR